MNTEPNFSQLLAEDMLEALPANDYHYLLQEAARRQVPVVECALALLEDEINRRRALVEGSGAVADPTQDLFEIFT